MPAAKGRGKARSLIRKNQPEIEGIKGLQRPVRRRRTNILHRVAPRKASNVDDVLYRFLEDLAAVSNNKRPRKMKNSKIKGSGRRSNKTRKTRAKRRLSDFSFPTSESPSKSIFESISEDNESMTTAMESMTTRPSSSCSNTSTGFSEPPVDSKKDLKDLLKKKSVIETLKNCANAIEAEEQRAKNYMKKAISYGINAGFLKPVDNSGCLLEISSDLPRIKVNIKRDRAEERKRRKYMRRGIVNFDDYEMKPVKGRNSSKLDNEKHEKGGKTVPKKRARSITRNSKPALKADEKKKEKNQLPKKRAKVSSQPRSRRNTRSVRTRRSPTPWRSLRRSLSGDQNEESLDNNDKDNNNDHQDKSETKERNNENNNIKEKIEKRRMVSTPLRKEDGKNYMQDSSMHGNLEENFNHSTEIQESVGNALQQGDNQ